MKVFCSSLREQAGNVIRFEKKENVTANKKRAKITSRFNSMLHLQKKFTPNMPKIKIIVKLETIAIL